MEKASNAALLRGLLRNKRPGEHQRDVAKTDPATLTPTLSLRSIQTSVCGVFRGVTDLLKSGKVKKTQAERRSPAGRATAALQSRRHSAHHCSSPLHAWLLLVPQVIVHTAPLHNQGLHNPRGRFTSFLLRRLELAQSRGCREAGPADTFPKQALSQCHQDRPPNSPSCPPAPHSRLAQAERFSREENPAPSSPPILPIPWSRWRKGN